MTFEEYVASRGPALVRLARLLTAAHHRAEDLAQDVLARAYLHWRRIQRTDPPRRVRPAHAGQRQHLLVAPAH